MRFIYTFLFVALVSFAHSQSTISGRVTGKSGEPLPGVNVFIENTYDGASSDAEGQFKFTTTVTGQRLLRASFVGFKSWQQEIMVTENPEIHIVLNELVNTLDAVTITAGSFAAADESRASIMKPLDIYTTPSANGDVMAAMRTMPGTQAAADDGRLLVRGGDVYETKTFIDGLVAAKPYYSKTPDIASRGRFSPSLFSGVMFSSGGYSAEYGQALSSVLVLNSNDLAPQNVTGISLLSIGGEASITKRQANSSFTLNGNYTNLSLYDKIFNSTIDWQEPVEAISGTAVYRYKPQRGGMFKGFLTSSYGKLSYWVPNGLGESRMLISNKGLTTYSNFSFKDCLTETSCYTVGVSATAQQNKIGLGNNSVETDELNVEAKLTVVHALADGLKLSWGANNTYQTFREDYVEKSGQQYTRNCTDNLSGGFVEGEIKFTRNLAIRPGLRSEYTQVLNQWNLAPRFAVALKTGANAQLSAAWGKYHQTPQTAYLKLSGNLDFERATHYIVSFQSGEVSKRLFRAEAYYKTYQDLITWQSGDFGLPVRLSNEGNGYAGGLDVFWRDQKSIKGLDYWITYSWIDTKRKYKNYPEKVTPDFISDHTFSIVGKYWLNKINTQVGVSYTAASGRPYNNPNSAGFMKEKTNAYSDLSVNFSHIFYIGSQYSVLYCSMNNVLGNDNVLSYRAAGIADAEGNYALIPVKRDLKRMVFIGLFLNF